MILAPHDFPAGDINSEAFLPGTNQRTMLEDMHKRGWLFADVYKDKTCYVLASKIHYDFLATSQTSHHTEATTFYQRELVML